MRLTLHAIVFILLTILTQLGGIAWLIALMFRWRIAAFVLIYAALTLAATQVAPVFGRVAVGCLDDGPVRAASPIYCALNRTYVSPQMAELLDDLADGMERQHPGIRILLLDGNFPFFDGFPLIPHLSHDDGRKADLALFYRDATGYLPGAMRSPLGYFAFEDGPTDCPHNHLTLRWDLAMLQPVMRDLTLDTARTGDTLRWLADDPRVSKIFVEPHLRAALGLSHPKLRFQGCRAARHDDHIHFEIN